MRGQGLKKRGAQISFLFAATKTPWEQGTAKHSEQKAPVSLLPFKSQNIHRTHAVLGRSQ